VELLIINHSLTCNETMHTFVTFGDIIILSFWIIAGKVDTFDFLFPL